MNIIVSACLLGENVKYNGGNNHHDQLINILKGHNIIPVCPEVAGGLPIPRAPVEIKDGHVLSRDGKNFDKNFAKGCRKTIQKICSAIDIKEIDFAILQSRSPSCGVNEIYDGSFSGKRIKGQGIFVQHLLELGIHVLDIEDFTPEWFE